MNFLMASSSVCVLRLSRKDVNIKFKEFKMRNSLILVVLFVIAHADGSALKKRREVENSVAAPTSNGE